MSRFEATNPSFEQDVRDGFARQRMMETIGASLALIEPGAVDIRFPHAPHLAQQNGFLHAGALASALDSACGYAALTLAPAGHDVLAVEFKINLLSPANAEAYVARARVLRAGRTLTVVSGEVFAEGGERPVAVMTATMFIRPSGE